MSLLRSSIAIAVLFFALHEANAQSPALQDVASVALVDVVLERGALRGQLLDQAGGALPNRTVVVEQKGRPVGKAHSDEYGFFRVEGLKGGVYLVTCGAAATGCRAWPAEMAPPSARPAILITEEAPLARGQNRMRTLVRTGTICTAVGAGIAVPLVLIDQEEDRKSGS